MSCKNALVGKSVSLFPLKHFCVNVIVLFGCILLWPFDLVHAEAAIGFSRDLQYYDQMNHDEFVSTMRQDPKIEQILLLKASEDDQLQHHWDYIYEPDDAAILLEKLLTRYIESQIYRAVIENIAAEQAARMLAMRNATDNAAELIANLQLICNKARQAAITRELSEIVAGASVLAG